MVKFLAYEPNGPEDERDPVVATVIFNWKEQHQIGGYLPDDPEVSILLGP